MRSENGSWGSFKGERAMRWADATRQEAREVVLNDLAMGPDSTRLPSSLGDTRPHGFERGANAAPLLSLIHI